MAKQVAAAAPKKGIADRVRTYIDEIKTEMSKVSWPSKDELRNTTQIVFVLLGIIGLIIAVFDLVFQNVMLQFLKLG